MKINEIYKIKSVEVFKNILGDVFEMSILEIVHINKLFVLKIININFFQIEKIKYYLKVIFKNKICMVCSLFSNYIYCHQEIEYYKITLFLRLKFTWVMQMMLNFSRLIIVK